MPNKWLLSDAPTLRFGAPQRHGVMFATRYQNWSIDEFRRIDYSGSKG